MSQCHDNKVPKLAPENKSFWFLFRRIVPGLFDGFGGVDFSAMTAVFDVYQVPPGQRLVLWDKCLVMVEAYREVQEATRGK